MPVKLREKLQKRPGEKELKNSVEVLSTAIKSANTFLISFNEKRELQGVGTTTNEQQDLLRSMLVFSAAGFDSMIKYLIKDSLMIVIERDEIAKAKFEDYVENNIQKDGLIDAKLLTEVVLSEYPFGTLVYYLINFLTKGSMQSVDSVLQVMSFLGIDNKYLIQRKKRYKQIFDVRNRIIHEMDVKLETKGKNRHQRGRDEMVTMCNDIFDLGIYILDRVSEKLAK